MSTPKNHGYCITIIEDWNTLMPKAVRWGALTDLFSYVIIGFEKCPSTGKQHGQGYVWFTKPVSFFTAKRFFTPAHVEVANLSPNCNYDYCTKDYNFFAQGDINLISKLYSDERKSLDS